MLIITHKKNEKIHFVPSMSATRINIEQQQALYANYKNLGVNKI